MTDGKVMSVGNNEVSMSAGTRFLKSDRKFEKHKSAFGINFLDNLLFLVLVFLQCRQVSG